MGEGFFRGFLWVEKNLNLDLFQIRSQSKNGNITTVGGSLAVAKLASFLIFEKRETAYRLTCRGSQS
jgi:hypothetical protein